MSCGGGTLGGLGIASSDGGWPATSGVAIGVRNAVRTSSRPRGARTMISICQVPSTVTLLPTAPKRAVVARLEHQLARAELVVQVREAERDPLDLVRRLDLPVERSATNWFGPGRAGVISSCTPTSSAVPGQLDGAGLAGVRLAGGLGRGQHAGREQHAEPSAASATIARWKRRPGR